MKPCRAERDGRHCPCVYNEGRYFRCCSCNEMIDKMEEAYSLIYNPSVEDEDDGSDENI